MRLELGGGSDRKEKKDFINLVFFLQKFYNGLVINDIVGFIKLIFFN